MSDEVNKPAQHPDSYYAPVDRSELLTRLAQQSPRERMQAAQTAIDENTKCARCGSSWFLEGHFNQYRANVYGANPGADLSLSSTMSFPIRICLCGMPVAPNLGGAIPSGRTIKENTQSFSVSVAAAMQQFVAPVRGLTSIDMAVQDKRIDGFERRLKTFRRDFDDLEARTKALPKLMEKLVELAFARAHQIAEKKFKGKTSG